MQMQSVKSSNIKMIGYDVPTKTLRVQFTTGTYDYADVPYKLYAGLSAAKSPGKFLADNIKDKFKTTKLAPEQKADAMPDAEAATDPNAPTSNKEPEVAAQAAVAETLAAHATGGEPAAPVAPTADEVAAAMPTPAPEPLSEAPAPRKLEKPPNKTDEEWAEELREMGLD